MERHHNIEQSEGLPSLTKGGILQLIESEGKFSFAGHDVKQPILQIINIRRVPAK